MKGNGKKAKDATLEARNLKSHFEATNTWRLLLMYTSLIIIFIENSDEGNIKFQKI